MIHPVAPDHDRDVHAFYFEDARAPIFARLLKRRSGAASLVERAEEPETLRAINFLRHVAGNSRATTRRDERGGEKPREKGWLRSLAYFD